MFVTSLNTDCSLARKLYAAGYEIADHTITHPHVSTGLQVPAPAPAPGCVRASPPPAAHTRALALPTACLCR